MKSFKRIMMSIIAVVAFSFTPNLAKSQVSQLEFEALKALYKSTDGDNWTNNTGWDTTLTANDVDNSWYGLAFFSGDLTSLNLRSNNLSGQIPVELGNFSYLYILGLAENLLVGEIPQEIGNLLTLGVLSLSSNQLTGPIPDEIGNLINLKIFDLSHNLLEGPIPPSLGNLSPAEFLLNNNNLSGHLSVELGNVSCSSFDISNNHLSGEVPIGISSLTMCQLNFAYNDFTSLPSFTNVDLSIENNYLTFESIEDNVINLGGGVYYSPQAKVGTEQTHEITLGATKTISVSVGGTANTYQWYKDDVEIIGAIATDYTITNFTLADRGVYTCKINNTIATELELVSHDITIIQSCAQTPTISAQSQTVNPSITTNFVDSITTTELGVGCNIISYEFDLSYDPTNITYTGFNLNGTIATGGNVLINSTVPGMLNIACVSTGTPFSGAGSLINLEFDAIGCEDSPLDISNFRYNGIENTNLQNGLVTIGYIPGVALDSVYAIVNNEFLIPVATDTLLASNCTYDSCSFSFNYDEAHISYLNYTLTNSIDPSATVTITPSTNVLDVTIASSGVSFSGKGNLIEFNFTSTVSDTSNTSLSNFFYETVPVNDLTPGFVQTSYYGDVNTDTLINAFDAAILTQFVVGNPTDIWGVRWDSEPWRTPIADVDGPNALTANDVVEIMQHAVGLRTEFSIEGGPSRTGNPFINVRIEKYENEYAFVSKGDLFGFEILSINGIGKLYLGQPERTFTEGSYAQNNLNPYRLMLASTIEIEPSTELVSIPTSNLDAPITFNTRINGVEKSYTMNSVITGVDNPISQMLSLYPNPSDGLFNISNTNDLNIKQITIIDISGKTVQTFSTNSPMESIDLSNQDSGVYFVKIQTEDEVYSFKAVLN